MSKIGISNQIAKNAIALSHDMQVFKSAELASYKDCTTQVQELCMIEHSISCPKPLSDATIIEVFRDLGYQNSGSCADGCCKGVCKWKKIYLYSNQQDLENHSARFVSLLYGNCWYVLSSL